MTSLFQQLQCTFFVRVLQERAQKPYESISDALTLLGEGNSQHTTRDFIAEIIFPERVQRTFVSGGIFVAANLLDLSQADNQLVMSRCKSLGVGKYSRDARSQSTWWRVVQFFRCQC
jgi:hypothetical protein